MNGMNDKNSDLERWSWMTLGGLLLLRGLGRGGAFGRTAALVGSALSFRAARKGWKSPMAREHSFDATITIAASREEVYRLWKNPRALVAALPQLESIEPLGDQTSRWSVRYFGRVPLVFTARILDQAPNRRLRWKTTGRGTIDHHGEVLFEDAPPGRGTEVHVRIAWRDPTGYLGHALTRHVGSLLTHSPSDELRRGLAAIKQRIETGETTTSRMRPLPMRATNGRGGS